MMQSARRLAPFRRSSLAPPHAARAVDSAAAPDPHGAALTLQRMAGNQAIDQVLRTRGRTSRVRDAIGPGGRPLGAHERVEMEARFGADFGDVRIHTDEKAEASAAGLGARAFAVGNDIAFGRGSYAPETSQGKRVLAHELAHVVQQRRGGTPPPLDAGAQHETAADRAASAIATGAPSVEVGGATGAGIARDEDPVLAEHRRRLIAQGVLPARPPKTSVIPGLGQRNTTAARQPGTGTVSAGAPGEYEPSTLGLSMAQAKADPLWVERDIANYQVSDTPPYTFTILFKDGSTLVIPLDLMSFAPLSGAGGTITFFRRHRATGRVVPFRAAQNDPRLADPGLRNLPGQEALFRAVPPRFDPALTPTIINYLNMAQMLFMGTGILKVLELQLMNPMMGGSAPAAAGGRAGSRLVASGAARASGERGAMVFVEIGAGDLKASIQLAKQGGVKVIAVDPVVAPASAVKELEAAGGTFIKGTAMTVPAGTADHVFQYFPWDITGAGRYVTGGTWRLVTDTIKLLRPGGAAHFVTKEYATAEFLVKEASDHGLRSVLTETTAGAAAPGASGAGVPGFWKGLKVWMVNIYK